MKTEPDFDTVDVIKLCDQAEQDDALFQEALDIFDKASLPEKLAIACLTVWLTTCELPQTLKLDYSDADPIVLKAAEVIKQMSDDCKFRFSYSLAYSFVAGDDKIEPPDCEFHTMGYVNR